MAIDITESPYFDDYDASKNFTKVVGVAGKVSQVREFTQAQDIQSDYLSRLGNAVLKNGTIVSGCSISIDQDKKQATVTAGQVFVDGLVRNLPETNLTIKGEGSEGIGVKITETLVKETDDDSLYDNAEGYRNYGNGGAHRIKSQPEWVIDDKDAVTVFNLKDGQNIPKTDTDDTQYVIRETLARRTFDENGSYKVKGLSLLDRKEHDADSVYVSVLEGKAYVAGYEAVKDMVTRMKIRKSTDTRAKYNETKTFASGVTYPFSNFPVKDIDEVNCIVQKTKNMTRGSVSGTADAIDDDRDGSVTEVIKVSAGDTVYAPASDYNLVDGSIDWSPGGKEPGTGTQYQVTYNYNQLMKKDEEYKLSHKDVHHSTVTYTITRTPSSNTDDLPVPEGVKVVKLNKVYKGQTNYALTTDYTFTDTLNAYKIDWSPNQSKPGDSEKYSVELVLLIDNKEDATRDYLEILKPEGIVAGSSIVMDYTFYLARADLIVMRPNTYCEVIEGKPDIMRLVYPPINSDERVLPIGTVTVYPNSDSVDVHTFQNYRLDQTQLYNVRQRVDNLEYDVAMGDLDEEAMEGETPTQLRGIFTDGFIGVTKADVTHTEFDCSFDFDNGYLMLPQNEGIVGMQPDGSGTATVNDGIASAPYEDVPVVEQGLATTEFLVNPYAVYDNLAIIELEPYVDNWVDSTRLTVDGGTSYEHKYEDVNGGTRYVDGGTTRKRETRGGYFADYDVTSHRDEHSTSYESTDRTSTSERTQTDIILDEAILYMRPIEIKVKGSNFTVNADDLTCYFNDIKVNLTPEGTSQQGTTSGTVKSDSNGKFEAKFTIPEGVPCGNVEVRVENENNHGGTRFSAQGRRQIIQDTVFKTVTTTTTRTKYDVVTRYTTITTIHDPLAQSFYVDDDCVLTKIDLFFSAKDDTKNFILEVRDLDNGYPSANVMLQQVVDADEVVVSEDASKPTTIKLEQPLFLEGERSYCFVIVSDSNKYKMWTAELGGIDEHSFDERYQVVSQPYMEGVMFSSSNAQTWTAHQGQDLKFTLYRAKFTGPGTITYPEATLDNATALVLAAQSADYANQGVHWYYFVDDENPKTADVWLPIETFCYWNLDGTAKKVSLKCELSTESDNLSPFLNVESVNLIYYNNEDTGKYVSRQVVMEQAFDTLQVSVEAYTTDKTSFKMFYSLVDDDSVWNEMTSPVTTPVDQYFTRYTFTKSGLPANTNKVRMKIEMTSEDKFDSPVLRKLIVIMKNV